MLAVGINENIKITWVPLLLGLDASNSRNFIFTSPVVLIADNFSSSKVCFVMTGIVLNTPNPLCCS